MRHWRRGLAGIAVVAAATIGVAASAGASSGPPGSDDDGGTAAADPREELVDEIVASYGSEDIPLDHECVSDAVTAVPAGDIDALLSILAGEDAVTATGTEPASPPTTALATDVDALGDDILLCVDGDADPELVEQVVTILQQSDEVPELDIDCARRMLSIVPDDVLELVIADPMGTGPLESADIDTTAPLFMLLVCSVSDPFAETPVSTA